MRRRDLIVMLGGTAVAWPLATRAQPGAKVPRVGFLYTGPQQAAAVRLEAMLAGLRMAGYSAPAQVQFVVRAAEGDLARIGPLMAEIIAQNVDAICASGPSVVQAARSATQLIPILAIDLETDPVASSLVGSIAHPGGNITGVFFDFPDFTAKWLELLRETSANLSTVAVLWDPTTGPTQITATEHAAGLLNIKLEVLEIRTVSDFDQAFGSATRRSAGAVLLLSSPLVAPNVQILAELAVSHQLPAITLFPDFARAGGLLAYGPNLLDMYRQAGVMIGKVLQGRRPAELPIERPTKFELVVNVKAAKALGITIPPSLLARADELIE
jgi:putative ABC transport system substrate-binding protein